MHTARVLVVDDTPEIHADMRKLLARARDDEAPSLVAQLLGGPPAGDRGRAGVKIELDSAYQGQEALTLVQAAVAAGRPYSLAFVDMRMPPGWDGVETIEHLWQVAPDLQVVICTAYSDRSWEAIRGRLGNDDRLLILKKPFDGAEAQQMAWSLTEKARLNRAAAERQAALEDANRELQREIERRRTAETRLMHDALHDGLTDLPNRTLVSDRIERALTQHHRDPSFQFALLFIDLDDFKVVNDSLGHAVGDCMLVEIAARIVNSTRRSDCATRNQGHTSARLGGDEFVVLLEGLNNPADAEFVARRILDELAEPLSIGGKQIQTSASVGIALGSVEHEDAAAVLRDADTALYRAKARGKSSIAVFDQQMRRDVMARLRVETELRAAIAAGGLFLQYQPIVTLNDARIAGFEALVRWRHRELGVISPAEFVPVAEEAGLIFPLGLWVLRTACAQTAAWRSRRRGAERLFVSVNFSSRQFMAPDFVEQLTSTLDEVGLGRDVINLELTESLLMQAVGHTALVIQQLKREGIKLHIDDFGTGFSSLSYLNQLPASAIKLDKSFLHGMEGGGPDAPTIRAVIEMAHARGLRVIAEGVETAEQQTLLQALGCDMAQGYLFSRPVDPDVAEHMLQAESAIARSA